MSGKEYKAPDKCPGCDLRRQDYVDHYLAYWKSTASGAGRAWFCHTSRAKDEQERDCRAVKAWMEKTKDKTYKDFPDGVDIGLGVVNRRSPSAEPEKQNHKPVKAELPLTPEELSKLMDSDPGEACRRMIASSFSPAVSEAIHTLKKREREHEEALAETRARIKKLKASADEFQQHMVAACKHVGTIKSECDAMG